MSPGQNNAGLSNDSKAARCGEPSYIWREGQQRRLEMILNSAGERSSGVILENGCGVGQYVQRLAPLASQLVGLEIDYERAQMAAKSIQNQKTIILSAAGEDLPFPDHTFDLILSHEVIEHVKDDRRAVYEMVRTLKPGGRIVLFAPNRGYPFETHGIYWKGKYRFGNIPFVNYLPRNYRDRLAPHVRVYTPTDLTTLFQSLPVRFVKQEIIFGAYDNIIARNPLIGKTLRAFLHFSEKTPIKWFGLSHYWVIEKIQ